MTGDNFIDLDVIVRFRKGKLPVPARFRYFDEYGDEIGIRVNNVERMRQRNLYGRQVVEYLCLCSTGTEIGKCYLQYIPENHTWRLIGNNC